jgi:hypothetical protein
VGAGSARSGCQPDERAARSLEVGIHTPKIRKRGPDEYGTHKLEQKRPRAQATHRSASSRLSHSQIGFQLAKFRLTEFPSRHRAASGRTRDTSWSRNALDFMNTAKCPPPSIGTNAFAGALMESTNERARTRENLGRHGRIRNSVVRARVSIAQNSFRTERGHWVHPRGAANWDNQRDRRATN